MVESGINPLLHYLLVGKREGRVAEPAVMSAEEVDRARELVANPSLGAAELYALLKEHFDPDFYLGA